MLRGDPKWGGNPKDGICVSIEWIDFVVQQRLTQQRKATILQLKKKKAKKEKALIHATM